MLGVWFPGARLGGGLGASGWKVRGTMHFNLLITEISIRPDSSPTSLEALITYTPASPWVTRYRVNVPFFEHIVTPLARPTLFRTITAGGWLKVLHVIVTLSPSLTCLDGCIDTVVLRGGTAKTENIRWRPAVLKIWARWVKVGLFANLGSHSL